ncbi:MAG: HAMP domain-containing histidine kinase [Clostridia bacterium]|nr:HAMP domain-containing histidine kinase [Clostridia bacterium]
MAATGVSYLYGQGCYEDTGSFFESPRCYELVWDDAYLAAELFSSTLQGEDDGSWTRYFSPENTNFAFCLQETAGEGRILFQSPLPLSVQYVADIPIDSYNVACYLNAELEAEDRYAASARVFDFLYPLRYTLLLAAGLAMLLWLALLTLWLAGAGKAGGEVRLLRVDRLPLEIYAAIWALAGVFFVWLPVTDGWLDPPHTWVGFLELNGVLLGAYVLLLELLRAFKARLKGNDLLTNTLTARLVKIVRRFLESLSYAWRTGIFLGASLLLIGWLAWGSQDIPVMTLPLVGFVGLIFAWVVRCAGDFVRLRKDMTRLADGELEARLDTGRLSKPFQACAQDLGRLADGMNTALEKQLKSERMKAQLIANVSHDIKTPLTSIINYADLLSKTADEKEKEQYLSVLSKQAQRLKKLTEDLVEASKATTGNLSVHIEPVRIGELLSQAVGEYGEKLKECGLEVLVSLPQQEVYIPADGRLMWRVLDNLLNNVCKYAMPNTRVYVGAKCSAEGVCISVKNMSREALNVSADELTERFVRGDRSRSTEGSGLGLNIAKGLLELQKSRLELTVDGDLFKAEMCFPEIVGDSLA